MATFNTETLKKLVSYAIQGAGLNDKIELSTYIGISVSNNTLYLNTTDGTNYLRVTDSCDADDMDITVDAETFSKLIGKINSDTIDLAVVGNTLVVTGNGTYKLGIIPTESGNPFIFPDVYPIISESIGSISASDLLIINSTIKASLSSVVDSVYSSYYFGDVIASTDRYMMSVFNRKIFDTPYILDRQFVDLMCLGNVDVTLSRNSDTIISNAHLTDTCEISVCAKIPTNTADFNVSGVDAFMGLETPSFCRIKKAQLLDLLDRLSLFVDKFDQGAIELHFMNGYAEISSMASSGVECVEYTESKDFKDTIIKINIDRLRNQLKAHNSDIVDIYYGSDMCIKLVDGDITQVIALIK